VGDLYGWIAGLIIALIAGGVGWSQVFKHGVDSSEKKQARKERDAAKKKLHEAKRPKLTPNESGDFIDRL